MSKMTRQMTFKLTALALACILISQPLGFAEYIKVDANQYQPVISAEDAEKRIQESEPSSPDTSLDFLNDVSPLSRPSVFHSIIQSDWWLNIALTLDKANTSSRNFNAVFTGTQPDDTDLQISYAFNSLDPAAFTPWQTFSSNLQLELPDYEGVNYVNFKVKDSRGNEKLLWSSIRLDRVAPTASIILGDGTGSTSTKFVTLHTTASDSGSGLFEMSYSINSLEESAFSAWEAFNPDKPITLTPWQGDQYVNVRVRDRAGNTTFTWNKINYQAANPALILNSGMTATNSQSIHVQINLGENFGAVTEMSYSVNSIEESAFTAWGPYANAADIQIPAYEGTNYITFRFRNNAGNSRWIWNTIKFDKTPPAVSILSPTRAYTASHTLDYQVLDNLDILRSVSEMVTLVPGDNTLIRTITDAAGNPHTFTQVVNYIPVSSLWETYNTESVPFNWITTTQATGVINDDQSKSFTLPFSFNYFGQATTQIQVSSNGFIQFGECNSCTSSIPGAIPNTSAPNYIAAPLWRDLNPEFLGGAITYSSSSTQFVVSWDNVYNRSSAFPQQQRFQLILNSDGSLIFQYDTVTSGPTTLVGIENTSGTQGVKYKALPANQTAIRFTPYTPWSSSLAINQNAVYSTNLNLSLDMQGDPPGGSAIKSMRFSDNGGVTWSSWEAFSATRNLTVLAGNRTVHIRVQMMDASGTVSSALDTIILDTTAPTGSIQIEDNMTFTNNPAVTLNLTAADTGSGIDKMRFSTDAGATWSEWENFSAAKTLNLPSGNGEKEVRYQLIDKAGGIAEFFDAITLDTSLQIFKTKQEVRKTITLGPLLNTLGETITYSFTAPNNLLLNGQFQLIQNQLNYFPASGFYATGFTGSGLINIQAVSSTGSSSFTIDLQVRPPQLQTPNDPELSDQYGMRRVNAVRAWNLSRGEGIKVAVIDTGVDASHPDLAENIFTNINEIAGDGIDNDGNGFIDDRQGWDFVNSDNNARDDNAHGTHVAGILGAVANNGVGGSGIAPEVDIIPIKVLDANGTVSSFNSAFQKVAQGILYAVKMGAKVINLSLGYWTSSLSTAVVELVRSAINTARQAGVIVVAAAGNESSDTALITPASMEGVITVGATTRGDSIAPFSNTGDELDFVAPGVDILSTVPSFYRSSLYADLSGTSMATPFVSGLIAMLISQDSTLTEFDIMRRLRFSSLDYDAEGHDTAYGYGRIDAFRALSYDYYDNGAIKTQWLEQADENGWTRLSFDQNGYLTGGI